MKTALVTGSSGFIGSHVCCILRARGWRVVGMDPLPRGANPADHPDVWIPEFVTSASLASLSTQVDAVIICAGSGSPQVAHTAPHAAFDHSTRTVSDTLEYCRLHQPGASIVLLSSAAVYGRAACPMAEAAPAKPLSHYGYCKLAAEQLCQSYARNFGRRTAIVRAFSVYGPGLKKQLLWDACTKFARRDAKFFGTGEELRDWIAVEDLAELVVHMLTKASTDCPVVNGGTGRGTSIRAVLTRLRLEFSGVPDVEFVLGQRAFDPVDLVADPGQATASGWVPSVAIGDGLVAYAKWFKALDPKA